MFTKKKIYLYIYKKNAKHSPPWSLKCTSWKTLNHVYLRVNLSQRLLDILVAMVSLYMSFKNQSSGVEAVWSVLVRHGRTLSYVLKQFLTDLTGVHGFNKLSSLFMKTQNVDNPCNVVPFTKQSEHDRSIIEIRGEIKKKTTHMYVNLCKTFVLRILLLDLQNFVDTCVKVTFVAYFPFQRYSALCRSHCSIDIGR